MRGALLLFCLFGMIQAAQAMPGPGTPYEFRLVSVHRRPLHTREYPVDLDLDGRDEILLVSDSRLGGTEPTFIQLHSITWDFIGGPRLPHGNIGGLGFWDLNGDDKKEVVVATDAGHVHVFSEHLDTLANRRLSSDYLSRDLSLRPVAALDIDGESPQEVVLAATFPGQATETTLLAFEWQTGRILWEQRLPGEIQGEVLAIQRGIDDVLIAAYSTSAEAGLVEIGSRGHLIRRSVLHNSGPADVSLVSSDDPLAGQSLVALLVPRFAPSQPGLLCLWKGTSDSPLRTTAIAGALTPLLICPMGTTETVVGTSSGDVVCLDDGLQVIAIHHVADEPIRCALTADLDLDSTPEVVCTTTSGDAICLRLADGAVSRCTAPDGVAVVRNGFGVPPSLVVRDGERWRYLGLAGVSEEPFVTKVSLPWPSAVILGLVAAGCGLSLGTAIGRTRRRRDLQNLLGPAAVPFGLVDRQGRVRWCNGSMEALVHDHRGSKIQDVLTAEGFHPADSRGLGAQTSVMRFVEDGQPFEVQHLRAGRDRGGRPLWLVCIERDTDRPSQGPSEVWAEAATELTAQMRTALSTIRLGAQRMMTHSLAASAASDTIPRLDLILRESARLQSLAGMLAAAAGLVEGDRERVDGFDLVRESLRLLGDERHTRIRLRDPDPGLRLRANRRQLLFALDVLYGAVFDDLAGYETIDLSMSTDGPGRVKLQVVCNSARTNGTRAELPRYATALIRAVTESQEGNLAFSTPTPGALVITLSLPGESDQ